MRVSELMLRDVTLVPSEDTVQNAARAIADIDSRVILVGVEDRIAGVLTIRDILIRLVAAGLDPAATPVSQLMKGELPLDPPKRTSALAVDRGVRQYFP